MSAPNDEYQPADAGSERGTGPDTTQDDYVNRPGQAGGVPVVSDNTNVEGGYADSGKADSDAQLEQDDKDAISQDNIMDSRTRGNKPDGGYQEPGDEEGLGDGTDGRSRVAGGPN